MAQGLAQLDSAALGEEITLSPEEESQLIASTAPVEQSPIESLSAQELADFSVQTKGDFNPVHDFRNRRELWSNPELLNKVAEANNLIKQRGFSLSDLPSPTQAVKGVFDVVKGVGKQAYNYAQALIGAPIRAFGADVRSLVTTGELSDTGAEIADESQRRIAENIAGTETAVVGLSQMAERGAGKIARGLGLSKPLQDLTPDEKIQDLWADVGKAQVLDAATSGKGAILGSPAIGKYVVEELEKKGLPVRPEEVSQLAAGDPVSFWAFGKAFQALGAGARAVTPTAVTTGIAAAGEKVSEALTKTAGATVTGAGKAAEVVGRTVQKPSIVLGTAMAVGTLKGGPVGALAAAGGAQALKGATKVAGRVIAKSGEKIADLGKQVSGTTLPKSNLAVAARDLSVALPGAAGAVAEGVALDLGIAGLTSERPEETQAAAAIGTALGLGKAAIRTGGRVLSGQIVAPRAWGESQPFTQVSNFPTLNAMSAEARTKAAPGVNERINAIQRALSKTDTEFYLAENAPAMEKALIDVGVPPEQAKTISEQAGFFTGTLPDAKGKQRRVVLATNIEAAPHESFHAIQDVMGESANRSIDALVKQEYAGSWEAEGKKYAGRLLGIPPEEVINWRKTVAETSGWIRAEVAEQIRRDVEPKFRTSETQITPPPEAILTEAARLWKEWQDSGANWRDVIPPERQEALLTEVSDRYIARELAAENFDAAFKNMGNALKNKGLLGKLANAAASTIEFLGGNLLEGRTSAFGKVPLKSKVVQATVEQARQVKPSKPTVEPTVTAAPETKAVEVAKITEWLNTADVPPVAGRTEAAQTLTQAMESGQGVRLSYWGAKGEPAGDPAALRPERRAQIESQRDAPNKDRQLVTKDYFPYRAVVTSKGPQFLGWSPNNFNANVTRFTTWLNTHPEVTKSIKLPYDLATEAGQRALQADLQTFVRNQQAGFTGSGREVVLPADVKAAGFTAPEKTGVQPVALPQERADIVNYFFNLRLPEGTRITGEQLPLNIVGQRISRATAPELAIERVVEPARPRGKFAGKKAEQLGIAGESISEVNPFRNAVEKAAKTAKIQPPELIEASQRLNFDRLADAEIAPELGSFGGNVLTLTAGFQPQRAAAGNWEVRGTTRTGEKTMLRVQADDQAGARRAAEQQGITRIENVRSAAEPVELATGMFQPQQLNTWEVRGMVKGERKMIQVQAENMAAARAEAEKQGLTRIDNVRGTEIVELTTGAFQPVPSIDTVRKSDPAGWKEITDAFSGKFGGGLTGMAMELGASAKSPSQLKEWEAAGEYHKQTAKNAIEIGDFENAMSQASKSQYFREALETAQDGPSAEFIRRYHDPEYKAPFPKVGPVEKKKE